ncbi:hypothetical protein SXCC_01189 [Gluconacetobacter sp. SXCC-1]|nr:hypothetical protein SXCC_01189 [Gluconacetobacter sp. SXCC-1]
MPVIQMPTGRSADWALLWPYLYKSVERLDSAWLKVYNFSIFRQT